MDPLRLEMMQSRNALRPQGHWDIKFLRFRMVDGVQAQQRQNQRSKNTENQPVVILMEKGAVWPMLFTR